MAKIYSPPANFRPVPQWSSGKTFAEIEADEEAWIEELRAVCRKHSSHELVGEIVRTGRGDGYAQYMVYSTKPLALIHLPIGDAWSGGAIWERGLRLSDVKQMVSGQRAMAKLFGPNRE